MKNKKWRVHRHASQADKNQIIKRCEKGNWPIILSATFAAVLICTAIGWIMYYDGASNADIKISFSILLTIGTLASMTYLGLEIAALYLKNSEPLLEIPLNDFA
jgi:hypothetical protein